MEKGLSPWIPLVDLVKFTCRTVTACLAGVAESPQEEAFVFLIWRYRPFLRSFAQGFWRESRITAGKVY